jgi:hypothetical protein
MNERIVFSFEVRAENRFVTPRFRTMLTIEDDLPYAEAG